MHQRGGEVREKIDVYEYMSILPYSRHPSICDGRRGLFLGCRLSSDDWLLLLSEFLRNSTLNWYSVRWHWKHSNATTKISDSIWRLCSHWQPVLDSLWIQGDFLDIILVWDRVIWSKLAGENEIRNIPLVFYHLLSQEIFHHEELDYPLQQYGNMVDFYDQVSVIWFEQPLLLQVGEGRTCLRLT